MNYRHAFHAGNFADVFKHAMLTRILLYLMKKPAALRVIDTHAGAGRYDLAGEEAARTVEWRGGIGRLCAAAEAQAADPGNEALALLEPYLAIVRRALPFYPGSPLLAAALLRRQDRLLCCELHPPTAAALTTALGRRAKVVALDGYMGLNAFVPPPERRGLVLVDPPFEERDEFSRLTTALAAAWAKWPTGVYAAWYPLKDPDAGTQFATALRKEKITRMLRLELQVAAPHPEKPLAANGLVVINPPFEFEAEARAILPFLVRCLAAGPGAGFRIEWLAGP